MAKSRKEGRQSHALARNPAYALQHAANKVIKGKAKKQARKADRALQTALHHLHTPDAGRRCRKEARRWVQAQLEAKCITGHVAMELFVFLQERTMGGRKKFTIRREEVSEEAEVVWARWLGTLAGGEGEGLVLAGNVGQADAILAEEGRGREGSGGLEAGEDDYQIMLSPEPLNSKEKAGALDILERDLRVVLCHRPRKIEEEEL